MRLFTPSDHELLSKTEHLHPLRGRYGCHHTRSPADNNDQDVEASPLQLLSITTAKKGTASVVNNQVRYRAGTKTGSETLSYQVSDGQSSSTGSLTISRR